MKAPDEFPLILLTDVSSKESWFSAIKIQIIFDYIYQNASLFFLTVWQVYFISEESLVCDINQHYKLLQQKACW